MQRVRLDETIFGACLKFSWLAHIWQQISRNLIHSGKLPHLPKQI